MTTLQTPDQAARHKHQSRTLTRRSLLHGMLAGGAVLGGGVVLSGCTKKSSPNDLHTGGPVTLTVGGVPTPGPYPIMPTKEAQAKDPTSKGYGAAMQLWLDDHPGFKLKHISFDTNDQQKLTTGITGGTAPDIFIGNVLGDWGDDAIRSAFTQGLAADCTAAANRHKFADKLAAGVKPAWQAWDMDGKHYGLPYEFGVGGGGPGVLWRRDFVQQTGMAPPTTDPSTWNWEYLRKLAKAQTTSSRKGISMESWMYWIPLGAEQQGMLTDRPTPATGWNWTADWTSNADQWVRVIENFRAMEFQDNSVMTGINMDPAAPADAFDNDKLAMQITANAAPLFANSADPTSLAAWAKKKGKSVNELVQWTRVPYGVLGSYDKGSSTTPAMISFSPDLDANALDTAVAFHTFMMGTGLVKQMKVIYDTTHDLQNVYCGSYSTMIPTSTIAPVFAEVTRELPGSAEQAWGKEFLDPVFEALNMATPPVTADYFPTEKNPAPSSTPTDDAINRWAFEPKHIDIRSDLQKVEDTTNKLRRSFKSSIPDDEFTAAAKKYFGAVDKFWVDRAPQWHGQLFAPWYESKVKPALGE